MVPWTCVLKSGVAIYLISLFDFFFLNYEVNHIKKCEFDKVILIFEKLSQIK